MLAKKFLKKWLNIPSRGVSDITFFHPRLLGIKPPSQLYLEGHSGNYINSRLKADRVVNAALDSGLEREGSWSRKSSTLVKCNSILSTVAETEYIPDGAFTYHYETSVSLAVPKIKEAANKIIANEYLDYFNEKVNNLVMQGDFISLLNEEEEDVTWKSIIFGLPRGVMSFACRSATNSLATNDNLKRWGKKSNSKCDLCSSTGTLLHTLNGCKVLLNSGAYLWRHDNILHYLAKILSENKKDNVDFYVDIPNYQINGSTLPPNVVVTNLRPDVVFIDKNTTPPTCAIYELTIPFETNLTAANTRKRDKYQSLKTDIQANGFK